VDDDQDWRMMKGPAYPAARTIASRVQDHFVRHLAAARQSGVKVETQPPDSATIESIIDAAFWASLRREEGYIPKISLAFLSPAQTVAPMRFEQPLTLEAGILARLAPAVERPGIHLGVWREKDDLQVWGTTRAIPTFCFVIEVVAPGLLVIKHRRTEESAKFVNVAVLEGDQIKILDDRAPARPDGPALMSSLLGTDPGSSPDSTNVLLQLAISMRGHGRGGSLLVVPAGSEPWRESIVRPISYSVLPPFSELADLVRETPAERHERRWLEELGRTVDAIAGLTAVDGATIMTDQYELLAFGAKILRREGWSQVEQVVLTEPIVGGGATTLPPAQLGGTRHISAAQFVQDQRDAFALVASQDGRFTVFAWSSREKMVHAQRVEALLL
jgi:hypothetical protein